MKHNIQSRHGKWYWAWGSACVLSFLVVPLSCNDRSSSDESRGAAARQAARPQVSQQSGPPGNGRREIERMIGAASISAIDSIDLRAKLVETAGIEGVRPMELAAQLVSQIQDADKQDTARFIVQSSFPKPEERIEFAKALPAGRTRSFAFAGLFDHYSRNLDWAGLTHLYQSVPLGKDRTQLAAQTLQLILDKQGVERALEYIEGLEMPEERRAAGMKLLSSEEAKKTSSDKVLYEKFMDLRHSLNLPGGSR